MRTLLLAAAGLALTGCVSLVPPATKLPPRYTLNANPVEDPGADLLVTLAIADARAEAALNTSRIAVMTGPNELRYLQDGEWSDRAPRVFSLLLERSFEEHNRLLAVSDRVALPVANYIFYADIHGLHVDRTREEPTAVVSFRARVESRRGKVLGSKFFSAEHPVEVVGTRGAARAINEAAGEVSEEAVTWALGLIEAAEADQS